MASDCLANTTSPCGIDMGEDVFDSMTKDMLGRYARTSPKHSVSNSKYEAWKREFTFEGIRGARYGQSFCNYFDITDHVLFYKIDWASADQYIRSMYLAKS